MVPAAIRPNRLAASTFDVATNPTIAEARATSIAASSPWVLRIEKSTRSRPPAARRHRAAFVATVVWNVTSFSRSVSTSCASGSGAVTSRSGSFGEHDPTLRNRPRVAGEAHLSERLQRVVVEPEPVTEVGQVGVLEPEPLEAVEAILHAGGHEEPPLRGKPADEEAERGRVGHAPAQVARGHVQLVQVRQQPARHMDPSLVLHERERDVHGGADVELAGLDRQFRVRPRRRGHRLRPEHRPRVSLVALIGGLADPCDRAEPSAERLRERLRLGAGVAGGLPAGFEPRRIVRQNAPPWPVDLRGRARRRFGHQAAHQGRVRQPKIVRVSAA